MYTTGAVEKDLLDMSIKQISKIIMSYPKAGLDVALDHSGVKVTPEIVENVLKRFENAGMLSYRFFEWAGRQHNYMHGVEAYHTVIGSLAKIRQFDIMWGLLGTMRNRGLLRTETFCIIMRKYARMQKVDEALYTFNIMEKYNVTPNLTAFNGLLSALCKSKNVRKAQEIFDKMKEQFLPDSKTYSILLEGWGKEPNLPKARELFREMVRVGCNPDIVTYGIMVDILCKMGRVDEALDIVKSMDDSGCRPTSFIYSILVHTYGVQNRIEDAIDTFLEMAKNGVKSDVVGMTDEAFRFFRKMIKVCEPDADTYTLMIKMFFEKHQLDMALKVWTYMKSKKFVPSMHVYSVFINGLCTMGKVSDASMLMEEMIEKGIQPSVMTFRKLRQLLIKEDRRDVLEFLQEKMNLLVKEPLCD
ncbi:hypothetical protein Cgig2_010066 [Carnegiea gigantea]|uniref:Pentatricopeptide repeat-containing protein n=1 Tax=Carnegiea gigantea TaxID=171969 RepID=A0A9Q1JUE9_9CARY|nr:hypothetical protein Cgig2_010066 [Carnegiea gigantea]